MKREIAIALATLCVAGCAAAHEGGECLALEDGFYRVLESTPVSDECLGVTGPVATLLIRVNLSDDPSWGCDGERVVEGCATELHDVVCVLGHGQHTFSEYALTYDPASHEFEGTMRVGQGSLSEGPMCSTLFEVRLAATDEFGEPLPR